MALTLSLPSGSAPQVVKAFVVLTPQFLSRDRDQLTKELQEHVKSVTAPYKYPRKVSEGRRTGWSPEPFLLLRCPKSQRVAGVNLKQPMGLAFFSSDETIGVGVGRSQLNPMEPLFCLRNPKRIHRWHVNLKEKIRQVPNAIQEGCLKSFKI